MHLQRICTKILSEVKASLRINSWYREKLHFLAGDAYAASVLKQFGLKVHRIFDNAPEYILEKPAFRMKHWMVYQLVKEFGEVVWIDWDTISMKPLDSDFFHFCRKFETPKCLYIPGYHATVNYSVYYVNQRWLPEMKKRLNIPVSEPNDELMWREVLPQNVTEKKEFWWENRL